MPGKPGDGGNAGQPGRGGKPGREGSGGSPVNGEAGEEVAACTLASDGCCSIVAASTACDTSKTSDLVGAITKCAQLESSHVHGVALVHCSCWQFNSGFGRQFMLLVTHYLNHTLTRSLYSFLSRFPSYRVGKGNIKSDTRRLWIRPNIFVDNG